MPLVDPIDQSAQVFWTTTEILDFARMLVNDAQGGMSGEGLSDARPYTWTLLNLCYARLQNWLEDSNVESATYAEAVISLPDGVASSDPNATVSVSLQGFVDSAGNQYESPTLPGDFLQPLQLWARPTGSTQPFSEMVQKLGGLGASYGYGNYRMWEYRQNAVHFLGAGGLTDIRIRYIPALPKLVKPAPGQPDAQIPFARAGEALAYMIAAEYAEIRNSANAPVLRAKAEKELQIIANKSAKRANQSQTRRRGYGFRRGR